MKLSAAIATYNEEKNIGDCLASIKDLVDEIVIVDGSSIDKTVKISKSFGAKVEVRDNPPIFHINKQRSFDLTTGDWVLYLDADERISTDLAVEIKKITRLNNNEIEEYQKNLKDRKLFLRHQKILENRDGKIGDDSRGYVAFFFPRLNLFLGKYLRYGGVYPDGVIRLFRKDKAYLPCKDVHEQMVVLGKVGWLQNSLLHMDSPEFKRYLSKNSRYIDLITREMEKDKVGKNLNSTITYFIIKPIWWFLLTQIRHKGVLDGLQGIIFSFFSALRFPRAFWRYLHKR